MLAEKFLTTLVKRNGNGEENEKNGNENEYKVLGLYMRLVDQIKHLLDYLDTVKECKDEELNYEPCKCVFKDETKSWTHVELVAHFKFSHHYHCSSVSILNQETEIVVYKEILDDSEENSSTEENFEILADEEEDEGEGSEENFEENSEEHCEEENE